MRVTLPLLKQALIGQLDKNNVIANNLANINTIGYKKDFVFFDALNEELKNRNGENQSVDLSQGELKQTSNPLDLALSGTGFFAVEREDETVYTRQGHFKLDNDGVLRTADGGRVLGENGPVVIIGKDIKPKNITITREGEIYADDEFIDRLQIVDFEDKDQLEKIGQNFFRASSQAESIEADQAEVHQGFLEGSNVNPADEMIQLIEVQRQFESIQRMVRSLDNVLRSAATQVGKY
jgi:flagellar basal-body rod protein FlgG